MGQPSYTVFILVSYIILGILPGFGQKTNSIQVFVPAYEEFSPTAAIRKTLTPDFANFRTPPLGLKSILTAPWLVNPKAVGISYSRYIGARSWRISSYYYHYNYSYSYPSSIWLVNGQSTEIEFVNLSGDYMGIIKKTKSQRLSLCWAIGGQSRIGKDSYWVYIKNPISWETSSPYRTLLDVGAHASLIGNWFSKDNIHVSAQLGVTQWLFLYSNILEKHQNKWVPYPLKAWNQLDFRVSIGYTFSDLMLRAKKN